MDTDWRPPLRVQSDEWEAEANRLAEAAQQARPPSDAPNFLQIEVDLGLLLLKLDKMKMRIEHFIREWDRTGDGSISKGEFRIHLLGLGLKRPSDQVDELFDKYDTDHGGTLDLTELKQ